jgi:hypothetical protein
MVAAHEKSLQHKQGKQARLDQCDMETAQKRQSESAQIFTE